MGEAWVCTLIFLYQFIDGFPIMALHNRYARVGSFEEPPRVSAGRFRVYHPVDSSSRGTWIGFNEAGLFAAATDQHTGGVVRAYRSRGLLLMDVLTYFSRALDALSYLRSELGRGYRRGNFILADFGEAFHVLHDERVEVTRLCRGVHIFTNITIRDWVRLDGVPEDRLRYTEMRRSRALELSSGLRPSGIDFLIGELMRIASDHGGEPGRGSICYHDGAGWYMSSSTIMALADDVEGSRILYCRGNPCKSRFIDYSNILHDGGGVVGGLPRVRGSVELSGKGGVLSGRRIALCLTGSVASIEAPKLARELRRYGADVTAYMTRASVDFGVSPKVMEWATSNPVVLELTGMAEHLARYDLVIVYPATLNTIDKIADGIADNAVTALCASTEPSRLLIAPAMNLRLYNNEAFRGCVERLRGMGVTFVEPRIGEGVAKVAEVWEAVDHVVRCLSISVLRGRGVLILTGPTRYDLDPVRYISNKSSGRLGYWLAREAFRRGCRVKVIYGPGSVDFPRYIPVVRVYTVEDMLDAVLRELDSGGYELAVFSAAILDFKPSTYVGEKVRSGSTWDVKLVPTVKVIDEVSRRYPELGIVGFKLECGVSGEDLIERGREELDRTGAVLVVANDLYKIKGEHHEAVLVGRGGVVRSFDGTKAELAREVFDMLEECLIEPGKGCR